MRTETGPVVRLFDFHINHKGKKGSNFDQLKCKKKKNTNLYQIYTSNIMYGENTGDSINTAQNQSLLGCRFIQNTMIFKTLITTFNNLIRKKNYRWFSYAKVFLFFVKQ